MQITKIEPQPYWDDTCMPKKNLIGEWVGTKLVYRHGPNEMARIAIKTPKKRQNCIPIFINGLPNLINGWYWAESKKKTPQGQIPKTA